MHVLLIRHALPLRVENANGPADPGLSAVGEEQAVALARWLADEPIDALYSSPMNRAVQTAKPIEDMLGLPLVIVDGVAEFDRHANEYVPMEELRAANDPRWHEIRDGKYFDDDELDMDAFRSTVVQAVDGIVADNPGRTVAVVCHGGVINAYLSTLLGLTEPLFFEPNYTSISRFVASRSGPRSLVSVNEAAHLRSVAIRP